MAEVYQNWAAQGASFHYASSSPWQLYHPLRSFLDAGGFPSGSVHLRWFRIRDEMFKRWRLLRKKSSKIGVINGIIKRLPKRRFVLVGDSGERDPEIYAKLARKYPNRVHSILIRNLSERPVDPERQQRLDARRGDVPLILFHDASDLAAIELPALTR
jgi:phosphatidate phosphatase APP1